MAFLGFILVIGVCLYGMMGGAALLMGAVAGFAGRGEALIGIILFFGSAALAVYAFMNGPISISWRGA